MTDSTDRLIEGLVGALAPVRPMPRLRSAFALILAVWAVLLGVVLLSSGSGIASGALGGSRVYLAAFVGLALAAVSGAASALAAGMPGRERLERGALGATAAGLLGAAVACLVGLRATALAPLESPPGLDAICFRHGILLALLPAGVIFAFLVRGWALHPMRAVAVALVASGALGALIVHLVCGFAGPRHLLVGHLSVPIVLAVLGSYPLALVLRRGRH